MAWWLVISLTLIGVWLLAYAFSGPKKKAGPLNISGEVEPAAPLARPAMPLPAKPEAKADAWDTGILRHSFAVARYEFSQSEFRAALKRLAFADRENKDRLLLAVDRLRAIGAHNEFVAAAAKVAHKQLGSTG